MRVVRPSPFLLEELRLGKVFIYPTDTIYGIGGNALLDETVRRIRTIKQRDAKPFSVIASKTWIRTWCYCTPLVEEWLAKLPGPYTLILTPKGGAVSGEVTGEGLGVRVPDHWYTEWMLKSGVPIVTTSVNLTGQPPLTDPGKLHPDIAEQVDYLVEDGVIEGTPSTVVDLRGDEPIVLR